ncbi:uncharacterized protein LOC118507930 [Anopheles stephensi]|uniref:uncharacterized protein LOC118507930 n=1 Tax=Anopheles stephensi TaxID=30069 RepID=UPI00165885A4|nr:uncharacterized protein LOC118507930 [Anopheles stephensi]
MVRQYRSNCTIYQSGGETRELGTVFMVLGAMQQRVIGWWPVNERICRLRIRGRFFNLSIINVHSPHLGSTDDEKELFFTQLEREYDRCPQNDIKIVIGDLNAQVGREEAFKPTIGRFSVHQLTNDNGLRLINSASSKHMSIRSTFFQNAPFKDHWRKVGAISTAAVLKIGHLPRRQRKDWFDEECTRALSEKNAARDLMLQNETRQNVENYE